MNLAELQQHFWDTVRKRGKPPPELERLYRSTDDLSATERMRIYHVAYWGRQLRVLEDTFAEVHALLGEVPFTRAALRYLTVCPSRGPRIEDIAPGFAKFLSAADPPCELAADLAALEAAALEALLAPEPRSLATATDIDPTRFASATIAFVKSLRVVETGCNALARFAPRLVQPELLTTGQLARVAIWRKRFTVHKRLIEPPEYLAYELASRGGSIANICAFVHEENPEAVAERTASMLSRWLAREWIARFDG